MTKLYARLQSRLVTRRDEDIGTTAVEYGLTVALISGAIVVSVTVAGMVAAVD